MALLPPFSSIPPFSSGVFCNIFAASLDIASIESNIPFITSGNYKENSVRPTIN